MADAFVLETLRTARTNASPRGGFASVSPVDLLVHLQRELVARTGMDSGRIEDVIIGCASQNAEQGANIARTATMLADWGDVPGATINRFCASGIDAVAQAAGRIRGGDLELVAAGGVAGGVEGVSRMPMFSDGGPLFCDPATGAILLGCVVDELERRGGRYGIAVVSGAAGLGVAVLVERIAS